ncbi:MAG: SDR family oxidoreductase, partial [Leptospiraceae bacterium]|nr:SDR family oxidoreductase [Leptospiraceae bacterium]
MGKSPDNRKMMEKIAKGLRTLELREALIKLGQRRSALINRPNVYTYTKSMAEFAVQEYRREHGIEATICRPSVVEASYQYPFAGWNEGIQGSVAILYLIKTGHRMIPSLVEEKKPNLRDAQLDVIPVDMVGAGTIMAMAALIVGRARPVYQLSAGNIYPALTITRMVDIAQLIYRKEYIDEGGVGNFLRRNMQTNVVAQSTYNKFSAPKMKKWMGRARDFLDRHRPSEDAVVRRELWGRARNKVETFYNLTQLKIKIFEEFLPFINGGYPVFHHDNTRELYLNLVEQEKHIWFFDPVGINYSDYFRDIHMPGLVKWVFPVMKKRIDAVAKASQVEKTGDSLLPLFQEALSRGPVASMLSGDVINKLKNYSNENSADDDEPLKGSGWERWQKRGLSWLRLHLATLKGLPLSEFGSLAHDYPYEEADFENLSNHIELVSGIRL